MPKHRHRWMKRIDFDSPWKLHRLFRNPNTKQVLVGCIVCNPKKKLAIRKTGRIYDFEGENGETA